MFFTAEIYNSFEGRHLNSDDGDDNDVNDKLITITSRSVQTLDMIPLA